MDANPSTCFIIIINTITSHKMYLDMYGARLTSTQFGIMFLILPYSYHACDKRWAGEVT